jgi:adenine-specific DNA-methyltransferase
MRNGRLSGGRPARAKFAARPQVEIRETDFLTAPLERFAFVIGNPPYVPITSLTEAEKALYRKLYRTACGRFDLYLLFFERALKALEPRGRLVFITPEKFLYVDTAAPLRSMLAQRRVHKIRLIDEQTFGDLVTYPTVTTVANEPARGAASVVLRDGRTVRVFLPRGGDSWQPLIHGLQARRGAAVLADICIRVSCGVATGADSVFVRRADTLEDGLRGFAFPTIAGRQLGAENPELRTRQVMLIPYAKDGHLLEEEELAQLGKYLSRPSVRTRLVRRTCVRRKPWYAFHENPPLGDILRPKILCKDIAERPRFWVDRTGRLVPRHSVYYIVPRRREDVDELCAFLNSERARQWLQSNCQRAANGFLRLQSHVLKRLPLPEELASRNTKQDEVERARRHRHAAVRRIAAGGNYAFEFAR